jgi:hypothetical protein
MKDSTWTYIKDCLLAPVLFVIDFTVTPIYNINKTQKRKYKNKTFFGK